MTRIHHLDSQLVASGGSWPMNRHVGASFTLSVLVVVFFAVALYPTERKPASPPLEPLASESTTPPGPAGPPPALTPGVPLPESPTVTVPEPLHVAALEPAPPAPGPPERKTAPRSRGSGSFPGPARSPHFGRRSLWSAMANHSTTWPRASTARRTRPSGSGSRIATSSNGKTPLSAQGCSSGRLDPGRARGPRPSTCNYRAGGTAGPSPWRFRR